MRKYKLIKEYPGSQKLGTVFCSENKTTLWKGINYYDSYPEFYKEVVEKDYEVLISRVVPQEILSVKRISDGEIFTIGDKARTSGSSNRHVIRQFRVKQKCFGRNFSGGYTYDGIDRIWIDWEEGCGGNWLESTEKISSRPLLFTTKDGVEIKVGDTYFFINTDCSITKVTEAMQGSGMYDERKYFSTYSAAENYTIKKCKALSIEDFWEFQSWGGSIIAKSKRLKRLVKERLYNKP